MSDSLHFREGLEEYEIELGQLRDVLGVKQNHYDLYSNFKNRVLISIQKEIAFKSDLYFKFDEIKHGRTVGTIRFQIFTQGSMEAIFDVENISYLRLKYW